MSDKYEVSKSGNGTGLWVELSRSSMFDALRLSNESERIARLTAKVAELEQERDAALATVERLSEYAVQKNEALCLGYEGGCDGDLEAEPHEEHCPARAKDMELNPHLYAIRAQEGK